MTVVRADCGRVGFRCRAARDGPRARSASHDTAKRGKMRRPSGHRYWSVGCAAGAGGPESASVPLQLVEEAAGGFVDAVVGRLAFGVEGFVDPGEGQDRWDTGHTHLG